MDEKRKAALEEVARAAKACRVEQKAWFGGDKSAKRLAASRAAEKALDAALDALEAKQGSLF